MSFLSHLEQEDRRELGAVLPLWRASAIENLHSLSYKLFNYTGSCTLKSVWHKEVEVRLHWMKTSVKAFGYKQLIILSSEKLVAG